MPSLRALRANAASALGTLMSGFSPGAARVDLLRQLDTVGQHLVTIAVATLLLDGETQKFHLNMVRAAENGLRFLALFRRRGLDLPPASRNLPLRAALTAGDFARAQAIAASSRDTWAVEDDEYEREFQWARVLQAFAVEAPGDAALPLRALSESGDEGDRVAMAQALGSRNGPAFDEAFARVHAAFGKATEERAKSFATPWTSFAPHRFLWLEGLAWLRLAARAGIEPEDGEYRYCPRLARLPMTAAYAGDWAIPASS